MKIRNLPTTRAFKRFVKADQEFGVAYEKADGTIAHRKGKVSVSTGVKGTLDPDQKQAENEEGVVRYHEEKGWRSFKLDAMKELTVRGKTYKFKNGR